MVESQLSCKLLVEGFKVFWQQFVNVPCHVYSSSNGAVHLVWAHSLIPPLFLCIVYLTWTFSKCVKDQ